ncbi:CLUMA_CG005087, isoform A [Clunio marinus]|uniref:CLUMA_CG005087, isoform A n=1 Tax=Clunio marinus TaxID=568069 RepID=A0A1J1HTM3_9DIPT|nr:CLUMA_CG005087, isoform A [Clunio marinus]
MSLEVYNYKIITTNTSELLLDSRNLMENLPEEILITIFSFLSPKLLKITTLVSRRWNQIISNSPKLMKHYLLNITSSRGNLNKIPNLTRKIESFHIDNLKKETFDILTIHNIRSLMFTECKLEKCELSAALKPLTKLESLKLFGVKLNESTRNASVGIVYLMFIYRYGIGNENFTDLVNLIKNQQSLETLKILENNSDDLIQNKAFLNLPFKLKTFEIGKIESDSNLMTFLLLHQEKLINLSFICKLKAQNLLLLAKNFSQLERLTISCNFQCVSESKVEFSSKLKRLKLIGYLKLPQAQQLFTILFPSVTKVCFNDTKIDKSCCCFLHSHESFQETRPTNIDDLFTVT